MKSFIHQVLWSPNIFDNMKINIWNHENEGNKFFIINDLIDRTESTVILRIPPSSSFVFFRFLSLKILFESKMKNLRIVNTVLRNFHEMVRLVTIRKKLLS